jgi:hypothetical protein
MRYLRLALFCSCVVTVCVWYEVQRVSAELSERTLSIGRKIASARDPAAGTSVITVNGTKLVLTSVSSDDGVGAVLDRFSAMCSRDSGGMREEVEALIARGADIPAHVADAFGVFRAQTGEREGTAACFAREGAGGIADLLERIEALLESGDLAAFGQLRYVFAHKRDAATPTHVLTVMSSDALPLEKIFPSEGDAPGEDLLPGVRPTAARRIVSAVLQGSAQGVSIYDVKGAATAALQPYDAALPALGYARGDLSDVHDKLPAHVRVFFKADETLLVVGEDLGDSRSHVSAFRLANGGFASMEY